MNESQTWCVYIFRLLLQDYFHCEATQRDPKGQLKFCTEVLEDSLDKFTPELIDIGKLEAIAGTRFGLTLLVDWMYKKYILKNNTVGGEDVRVNKNLIAAAKSLCDQPTFKWPRLVLPTSTPVTGI